MKIKIEMHKINEEFYYYTKPKESNQTIKVREDLTKFYNKLREHINKLKKDATKS